MYYRFELLRDNLYNSGMYSHSQTHPIQMKGLLIHLPLMNLIVQIANSKRTNPSFQQCSIDLSVEGFSKHRAIRKHEKNHELHSKEDLVGNLFNLQPDR